MHQHLLIDARAGDATGVDSFVCFALTGTGRLQVGAALSLERSVPCLIYATSCEPSCQLALSDRLATGKALFITCT